MLETTETSLAYNVEGQAIAMRTPDKLGGIARRVRVLDSYEIREDFGEKIVVINGGVLKLAADHCDLTLLENIPQGGQLHVKNTVESLPEAAFGREEHPVAVVYHLGKIVYRSPFYPAEDHTANF